MGGHDDLDAHVRDRGLYLAPCFEVNLQTVGMRCKAKQADTTPTVFARVICGDQLPERFSSEVIANQKPRLRLIANRLDLYQSFDMHQRSHRHRDLGTRNPHRRSSVTRGDGLSISACSRDQHRRCTGRPDLAGDRYGAFDGILESMIASPSRCLPGVERAEWHAINRYRPPHSSLECSVEFPMQRQAERRSDQRTTGHIQELRASFIPRGSNNVLSLQRRSVRGLASSREFRSDQKVIRCTRIRLSLPNPFPCRVIFRKLPSYCSHLRYLQCLRRDVDSIFGKVRGSTSKGISQIGYWSGVHHRNDLLN